MIPSFGVLLETEPGPLGPLAPHYWSEIIVGIILIAQPSVNIYFRKLSGKPMPRPGSSRHHSVPGPYEPFGAAPAPPTHWPYTGDNTIPRQSSSDGLTRPLGDDTMWRKPASSDGDEQPFEPPR